MRDDFGYVPYAALAARKHHPAEDQGLAHVPVGGVGEKVFEERGGRGFFEAASIWRINSSTPCGPSVCISSDGDRLVRRNASQEEVAREVVDCMDGPLSEVRGHLQ
jgi:hypothetical protein